MLTVFGTLFLGLLAYFIWSDYRDAPENRSADERQRNSRRIRDELAGLVGTLALAILLWAWIERSTFGGVLGAALVACVVLLDMRSGRDERRAGTLDQQGD